jgi:hypothetical protein
MIVIQSHEPPKFINRSQAKIWIRTIILAVFGTMFGISLFRDMLGGVIPWLVVLAVIVVCLPLGFWMRRLVPMKVHSDTRFITLSFDKIYFILIWLLVIAKAIFSYVLHLPIPADVFMCIILGLMSGRLSGICLRVHRLKQENGFLGRHALA